MSVSSTAEVPVDATPADADAAGRRPRVFYGWYMLGAMMGIHWYVSVAFVYGFGVLFVPILETFGWSRAVGSLTALFFQPVGGAVGPFAGMAVDRYGARRVAIVGMTLAGLGIMSLSWMQSLWMLFASFTLISIGMSSTLGVGFNTAIVNWFHRQRGRALGIGFSGAVLSGPFVGVVVWMESSYGWRDTALFLGIGALVLGVPLASMIRSRPSDMGLLPDGDDPRDAQAVSAAAEASAAGMPARRALGNRNFWLVAISFGLLQMGISAFMLHQIPYFESLGFSRAQAASTLAPFTLLSVFGRIVTGWVMDWMTRRNLDLKYVPAGLLALQCTAMLLVAHIDAYWQVFIFAMLFGTSFGGMIPSRPAILSHTFGLASFGKIQGLMNFAVVPFAVLAPLSLGVVFDSTGSYYSGVLLLAVLSAAGIPVALMLKLPRRDAAIAPATPPAPVPREAVPAVTPTDAGNGPAPREAAFAASALLPSASPGPTRRPPRDYMGRGRASPGPDYMPPPTRPALPAGDSSEADGGS